MHPPDLILITWNRSHYLKKMLPNLLADPADFRLYCWDNASGDETRDLIADLDDERVVEKHFHEENVGQIPACHWFFETAKSPILGKVDDDIILPHGWTERLARIVASDDRIGMVGCWIFMKEDWLADKTHINTVRVGEYEILRTMGMAGHSFLASADILRRYAVPNASHGLPVKRETMTLDGLINGIPLPPMFAHNMDDPRAPECVIHDENGQLSALTARKRGFETIDEYIHWIARDAREQQTLPLKRHMRRIRLTRKRGQFARVQRKLLKLTGLW